VTEIRLNLYYPHPLERVWRAITDSRAIASWLMENDFAPRAGHRFRLRPAGLPGFDGLIAGEVTEIVPLSRVRMTWRSGEQVAEITWVVKVAPGGSLVQIVHKVELGADPADPDRRETLEQTYAVVFEQNLPLVLHDFAVESDVASGLAEGRQEARAGAERPLEFPAAVEADWGSADLASGPVAGAGYAISGGGAYAGTVYGSAAGGPPSSPVSAMPQVGPEDPWGSEASPPSGVSLGDGLSLSGRWSSDGSGFGAYGAPLHPAAPQPSRTRHLILLSVGSLTGVLVFVFGAWAVFSTPNSPSTSITAPANGAGSAGVGVQDSHLSRSPSPGHTTGPVTIPNGGQTGAETKPHDPGGSGGDDQPDPQQTSDDGGTTPVDPPAASEPLEASYGITTHDDDPDNVPAGWIKVDVRVTNPNDVDLTDWLVRVRWDATLTNSRVLSGNIAVNINDETNTARVRPKAGYRTISANESVDISFGVKTTGGLVGCVINTTTDVIRDCTSG
jgi:uncharacterized protein YndB with AHSA1/START domain